MYFYGKHLRHKVSFGEVYIVKPMACDLTECPRVMFPHEARTRSSTYALKILVNIHHEQRPLTEEEIQRRITRAIKKGKKKEELVNNQNTAEAKANKSAGPVNVVYRAVTLCELPCMVRSKYCNLTGDSCATAKALRGEDIYDEGGYFVIGGNDKVMTGQLRLRHNRSYVFTGRKNEKWSHVAEIRSCHASKWRSTSTMRMGVQTAVGGSLNVVVNLPFILRGNSFLSIPFALLWSALRDESDEDGEGRDEMLVGSLLQGQPGRVQETIRRVLDHMLGQMDAKDAREWIRTNSNPPAPSSSGASASTLNSVDNILRSEFLPHIGLDTRRETFAEKKKFLFWTLIRLIRVELGFDPVDDRDSFANKCVHNTDALIAIIFRQIYRHCLSFMRTNIYKAVRLGKRIDVADFLRSRKMTSALRYHFATGNWSLQKNVNTGVVMPMPRICHMGTVSFKRKLHTQCNKDGKATECRHLHPSDVGISCICETPEGQSCGLVENLALLAHISMGVAHAPVEKVLIGFPGGLEGGRKEGRGGDPPPEGRVDVILNGIVVGHTGDPKGFVDWARGLRRTCHTLPFDVSVVVDKGRGGIQVTTDAGKCVRPLFRVDALDKLVEVRERFGPIQKYRWWMQRFWQTLVAEGIIEYLDKDEELCGDYRVANGSPMHSLRGATHVEIDPVAIFGLVTCSQPFSNHNQAPRNIYQTSMGKQALGLVVQNWKDRYDRHLFITNYPQRPIVTTRLEAVRSEAEHPQGLMATVAIMCYGGFNQEDSVILNQASVDRGLGRLSYYRTYQNRAVIGSEHYCVPGPSVCGRKGNANYNKLDPDGTPPIGTKVSRGDVLIGKVVVIRQKTDGTSTQIDQSVVMQDRDVGRVDSVVRTTTLDGKQLVKVRIRIERMPMVGDKFASRHAQKGTVGQMMSPEDMPFTRDGVIPDIIMNPNAIPSRMTVGQLVETVLGKTCSLAGERGDGTAFRGVDPREIGQELRRLGFHPGGKERMRCGMTGQEIEALIFIGPTYYQQLKHMVRDKLHSRGGEGANRVLTRQPMDGRSRNGGFRFGEMERDALICHGASAMMIDRMFTCSDKYSVPVCTRCGGLAAPGDLTNFRHSRKTMWCPACELITRTSRKKHQTVKSVKMPYATKLLIQELLAMHIRSEMQISKVSKHSDTKIKV